VTRSVTVRPDAAADLADAKAWYDDQRPGLGDEFLAAIADAFTRLEQNPEQFPFYYRDFRRVLVERFPYKVFFRTRGEADVIVFRVLHSASDHRRRLRGTSVSLPQ
jgi:plasmid stabilization system protein ParE